MKTLDPDTIEAPVRMEPMSLEALDAACSAEDRATVDEPLLDGTDGAHPAWWRGHDRATEVWRSRVETAERERDEARDKAMRYRDALRYAPNATRCNTCGCGAPSCTACRCGALATQEHDDAGWACDAHATGDGWSDLPHADTIREALR